MKCHKQANPQRQEITQWLPGAGGSGEELGATAKENEVSFGGIENILKFIVAMGIQL